MYNSAHICFTMILNKRCCFGCMKTHENYFELSCRRNSRSAYLDAICATCVSIVAAFPAPSDAICTSASLLNRSAFQLRFHTFTDSPWLDSVVPFVPLNHEIISHKFKLCCLITTSVRSWEVNAQELLHHAGQKPSQNCAVQLVEKVFIHSFQLIELALFQMTMASSKSERWNNPKTCSSTRCCKTISFWMALPSLASIYLHTWAGACAQARFNFW